MNYYLVAVGSNKYHGSEPLTYASVDVLERGAIVDVPLRSESCLGFVVATSDKPKFKVKEILDIAPDGLKLPDHLVSLFEWMARYYPAPLGVTAQLFIPKQLPKKPPRDESSIMSNVAKPKLPTLTEAQAQALQAFLPHGTHILHGETGSGKTRMYIELAKQALEQGKSSLILTPEISLTSQLIDRFSSVFGADRIAVIHSNMTVANRRNTWIKIAQANTPLVVIGARSALFSPISSLGLIVLDEAHEPAYKQENAPHYHASRVAATLGSLCDARVVLGSATPSVTDYFMAQAKHRPVIRIEGTALGVDSDVEKVVVDMRNHANTTRNPYLSNALLSGIDVQLREGSQTLLFLNRRGTARIVLCTSCGWQALCPHCDLPLTYHHDSHRLRCHACDFSQTALSSCPSCGNPDVTLKSIGTKTVTAAIEKFFPTAKVQRFDADNLTGERLQDNYSSVHAGEVDVLVGTQLLAKGLDLPKLGLIGVINADSSLYIPDYTAQERTFQLLHQVIGRVGRGHTVGRAIIQTYSPDNIVIKTAVEKQWHAFYDTELTERQQYNFPPYCHMLKASCSRSTSNKAEQVAQKVKNHLESLGLHISVEGPAPAFHEKVKNKYVWQLIIKSANRPALVQATRELPKDWSFDIDPIDLL